MVSSSSQGMAEGLVEVVWCRIKGKDISGTREW